MTSYVAYQMTVEVGEETIEIRRKGLMAKAVAPVVSIPVSSVTGANFKSASALVNGTLQITVAGVLAGKPEPSDAYTIVFRKKDNHLFEGLRVWLEKRAASNAAAGGADLQQRVVGRMEALAVKSGRDPNSFAGVRLVEGAVTHKDGGGPVAGATAFVETAGEMRRRITATRIVLTGVFALAWRKKHDDRELYLLVNGVGWAIAIPVPPNQGAEARAFAARINAAGSATAQDQPPLGVVAAAAAPAQGPIEQIEQLAALRDRGILSDDEFEAKKQDLLDRL